MMESYVSNYDPNVSRLNASFENPRKIDSEEED